MNYFTRHGFTLVELLVVLAIFSIIASMAAPSFSTMIERNRLAAESNRLLGSFRLARSEAIKRGELVTIAGEGGDWQSGFQIYANSDTNISFDADADQLIRREEFSGEGIAISSSEALISFSTNGSLSNANSVVLYLCRSFNARRAMEITINRIGRAESSETSDISQCAGG